MTKGALRNKDLAGIAATSHYPGTLILYQAISMPVRGGLIQFRDEKLSLTPWKVQSIMYRSVEQL